MNGKPTGQRCPYCEKGEIHVLSNERMCGCDACHSLFRYPSMVPFPTAGTEEAGVQIVRSSFAGKVIAMLVEVTE